MNFFHFFVLFFKTIDFISFFWYDILYQRRKVMNNERTDSFANRLAIAMQLNNINQIELSEKTKAF